MSGASLFQPVARISLRAMQMKTDNLQKWKEPPASYPVLVGAGIGLIVAFIALHCVRSLLYQTPVMDPLAIGGSVVLLLAAAAMAAIIPARRAASCDPMRALRME